MKNGWKNIADAYLLYKPEFAEHKDIQYLTGFTGTTAILLCTKKGNFLFVDTRYHEAAESHAKSGTSIIKIAEGESPFKILAEKFKQGKIKKVAIEDYTPIGFVEKLKKHAHNVKLVTASGLTLSLRAQKTKQEIASLEKAQTLTVKIFNAVLGSIRPGKQTELDVARRIREKAFEYGAEDMSFAPIVAFGPNSARPHHISSSQKIGKRGVLLIDFGIRYGGYVSDFTRTMWLGSSPSKEFKAAYETVWRAQKKGIEMCKFSKPWPAKEIDAIVRQEIDSSPFKGRFIHSTGHGVGLEIHEKPSISAGSKDVLCGGEVITIEPGVYLPGKFGIRIEDVVVTGDGKVLGV